MQIQMKTSSSGKIKDNLSLVFSEVAEIALVALQFQRFLEKRNHSLFLFSLTIFFKLKEESKEKQKSIIIILEVKLKGKGMAMCDSFPLCCRLKNLEMNTYLYAPKDDLKHRALWRDLYSPEETGYIF